MRKEKVGEIRISKRIVRIGHQVYPLANISRVQTLRLVRVGKLATFYPLREIAVFLLVVGAIVGAAVVVLPKLDLNVETAREYANVAASLAGVWITYLLFVLFYRLWIRRSHYELVIETAGTQYAALRGTNRDEIHRVEGEIVNALEDPPDRERIVHIIGDFVNGDKVERDKYQQG
ncbi:MAG: DUF6232 family protein [Pseudonocardiaceae bacterium]